MTLANDLVIIILCSMTIVGFGLVLLRLSRLGYNLILRIVGILLLIIGPIILVLGFIVFYK